MRIGFGVGKLAAAQGLGAVVKEIGHRVTGVGAQVQRRWVVGQDEQAKRLARSLQRIVQGADDTLVKMLNRFDFVRQIALMSHFIRRFNVQIGEVTAAGKQSLRSCGRLALVVGVQTAGCALHVQHTHFP